LKITFRNKLQTVRLKYKLILTFTLVRT